MPLMIILDEQIFPDSPFEFVAVAVLLSSLKKKSISIMLHGWKKISLLKVVQKGL